jgi:drug/metabolite transporter (DMT)-like permease
MMKSKESVKNQRMGYTYLFAISKINVAAAILLQYLAPSFIALHAIVFMREKLKPATITALAGATLGCYLVVGAYNVDILTMNFAGIISGILAGITFAYSPLFSEINMGLWCMEPSP